jgi:type 1 glutamine amidotransferase
MEDRAPRRLHFSPMRRIQIGFGTTFGKGPVFYSTPGQANEAWGDPLIQQMYFGVVKWVLGTTGDALPATRARRRLAGVHRSPTAAREQPTH